MSDTNENEQSTPQSEIITIEQVTRLVKPKPEGCVRVLLEFDGTYIAYLDSDGENDKVTVHLNPELIDNGAPFDQDAMDTLRAYGNALLDACEHYVTEQKPNES